MNQTTKFDQFINLTKGAFMLIFQSSRPLKVITCLGLALSIALLGACSSSDPTKETLFL